MKDLDTKEVVASIIIQRGDSDKKLIDLIERKITQSRERFVQGMCWLIEGKCFWCGAEHEACDCDALEEEE